MLPLFRQQGSMFLSITKCLLIIVSKGRNGLERVKYFKEFNVRVSKILSVFHQIVLSLHIFTIYHFTKPIYHYTKWLSMHCKIKAGYQCFKTGKAVKRKSFFRYFRMSPERFDHLLALVGPKNCKEKTLRSGTQSQLLKGCL